MQQMPAPRRWSASHVLVALIILAAGGYWIAQTLRRGSMSFDPANAPTVIRSRPADAQRNVPVDAPLVLTLRPGSVIDQETLDAETLRVLNGADGRPVPGRIVLTH